MSPLGWFGSAAVAGTGALGGNLIKQNIDISSGLQQQFDPADAAISTVAAVGANVAMRPLAGAIELEYGPTAQGLLTKWENGTIYNLAPQTAVRIIGTEMLKDNAIPENYFGKWLEGSMGELVGGNEAGVARAQGK